MLKPIKTFCSGINPDYSVFEEAKQIAIDEDCVVEVGTLIVLPVGITSMYFQIVTLRNWLLKFLRYMVGKGDLKWQS